MHGATPEHQLEVQVQFLSQKEKWAGETKVVRFFSVDWTGNLPDRVTKNLILFVYTKLSIGDAEQEFINCYNIYGIAFSTD